MEKRNHSVPKRRTIGMRPRNPYLSFQNMEHVTDKSKKCVNWGGQEGGPKRVKWREMGTKGRTERGNEHRMGKRGGRLGRGCTAGGSRHPQQEHEKEAHKRSIQKRKNPLTGRGHVAIMTIVLLYSKPLSKRSTRKDNLSESRGWWDHGRALPGEWTCEGGANAGMSVASDGCRTRYQPRRG